MTIDPLGYALLTIAHNAIARRLGSEQRAMTPHPQLAQRGASFVTLMQGGVLRGCIGSLEAWRPLAADVAENALAAAFGDRRFEPLAKDELVRTKIEVSLLEPPQPFPADSEAAAIAALRPGIDGLILGHGRQRATFLPQVWETLPEPRLFLQQLRLKAGLPADFWDDEITLSRYAVQKWKET